ncbi:MAG TPA: hypothetical protein VGB63_13170 [Pedobacter sp.]|jgi:hypothetical protein
MADKPKLKPEPRLHTWWTSRSGQRHFVIIGLWHGQHESVELLEYSHFTPIQYSTEDFKKLIEDGEIKPLIPKN